MRFGVMVIIVGNGIGDLSSNLDEAVCVTLPANAHEKYETRIHANLWAPYMV